MFSCPFYCQINRLGNELGQEPTSEPAPKPLAFLLMDEIPQVSPRFPAMGWKSPGEHLSLFSPHSPVGQTEAQTSHRAGPHSLPHSPASLAQRRMEVTSFP